MIKRTLTLLSILSATLSANASSDWYIAPHAGIGFANAANYTFDNHKPIFAYDFGVNIRRSFGKWSLETGVGMMQTGLGVGGPFAQVDNNNQLINTYDGTFFLRFKHLYVPVKAGYTIQLSSKWSVAPAVGVKLAYNLNTKAVMKADEDAYDFASTYSNAEFEQLYHRTSIFGDVTVPFQFNISSKIKLNAGPGFSYMLTPLSKPNGDLKQQHNYMVMYNLGMTYKL